MFKNTIQSEQEPLIDIEELVKKPFDCSNPEGSARCGFSYRNPLNDKILCLGLQNNFRVFVFSNLTEKDNVQTEIPRHIIANIIGKGKACIRVIRMDKISTIGILGENDILMGDPNESGSEELSPQIVNAIRRFDKNLFILYSGSSKCVENCQNTIVGIGESKRIYIGPKPISRPQILAILERYRNYLAESKVMESSGLPGMVVPTPPKKEAPKVSPQHRSNIFSDPQPADENREKVAPHKSVRMSCHIL